MILPLLLACAAWRPDAPVRFDLSPPPGWTVARNTRFLGHDELTLVAPEGDASVHVELIPLDARTRRLPLDLIAELRALDRGRKLGVESSLWRMDRIALDGHDAWAATGRRAWHHKANDYTLVVSRTRTHAIVLTLQVPPGGLPRATPAWAHVLDAFRITRGRLPDDAPVFEPDPE